MMLIYIADIGPLCSPVLNLEISSADSYKVTQANLPYVGGLYLSTLEKEIKSR